MQYYDLTYGERILIHRRRAHLTQKKLAEMADTTVSVINKMENDMPNPNHVILENLSLIFGVTINMLMLGFDDPKKNQPLTGLINNNAEN